MIAAITVFYCGPIILGTSYYYDDLFRAYLGYSSWDSDGRPFANLFYQVITFGQTMPDTFPLALIVSLVAFSLVGHVIGKKYNTGDSIVYCTSYAMLIMSPLFVSNLLFRYDSSFMVLALVSSIVPYAIRAGKKTEFIAGSLSLIISFGLYQAAVSIFIALAGIEAFRKTCHEDIKSAVKECFFRVMQLAISYVIYSKVILGLFVINDYFKSFNKSIELNKSGIEQLILNIQSAMHNISLMFSEGFIIAILPISAYSIYCLVKFIVIRRNYSAVFGLVFAIIAVSISIPGIAIFGMNPIFYPRIYIGAGALLFLVCVMPIILNGDKRITLGLQFILMFYLFGFVNATSNAVRSDVDYQKSTAERIINIIDSNGLNTNHNVVIIGALRQSPLSFINSLSYPLITVITPQHFINGYDGGRFTLMEQGLDNIEYPSKEEQEKYKEKIKSENPVYTGNLFSIYNINSTTIISFEENAYEQINKQMKPYRFKSDKVTNSSYGELYFHACIKSDVKLRLKRNEWYYLLFHSKKGETFNRNFFIPYSTITNGDTCLTTQWKDPINPNDVSTIEFGIYNIKTMERRIDLGS